MIKHNSQMSQPYGSHFLMESREDATNPDLTALERLALVRERAARIREIRGELETTHAVLRN